MHLSLIGKKSSLREMLLLAWICYHIYIYKIYISILHRNRTFSIFNIQLTHYIGKYRVLIFKYGDKNGIFLFAGKKNSP